MRRVLLVLAGLLLAWGVIVLGTGGVDWRIAGYALRSRAPDRAFALGFALLVVQAIAYRRAFAADVSRVLAAVRPARAPIALACAAVLTWYAVHFGSFTAGGADSSGYVSQAYLWASGALPDPIYIPIELPWPSSDASLSPLGYRPGPAARTMVPTYAPGLPLMMAASTIVGPCGPFLIVPAACALLVWLTFVLGRRVAGAWTGIIASVLIASSPIVLFMALVPMSDVPAAVVWTGALCAALRPRRADVVVCGLLAAAGLLIRPNLPTLPAVFFLYYAIVTSGRERWLRLALYSLPVALAAAAVALLFTSWYGAPWKSGYGAAEELFALSSIAPNLSRYPVWLWRSQSPLVLVALVPLLPLFGRCCDRRALWLSASLFLATLFSYLVYFQFEEWWYLRFLLPGIPALLVLVAAGFVTIGRRLAAPWGSIVTGALVALTLVLTTRFTVLQFAPDVLRAIERRYADVGAFVQRALPPNAIVLSVQESGSIRYYAGRPTIRWDLIERDWTSRAASEIERLGLHPFLVIEDFELPQFRDAFGVPPDSPLPWRLVARMNPHGGVSVFDMASRGGGASPIDLQPGHSARCSAPAPMVLPPRGDR